jgi:ketosteroid isomerase-like protein
VRRALAAWNADDIDAMAALAHPDFEIDASENVFNPRVLRGPGSLLAFREMVAETWDEWRFEVEEISSEGDRVTARVKNVGRAKLSGVEVESVATQVWTIRDGLLAAVKNHPSTDPEG